MLQLVDETYDAQGTGGTVSAEVRAAALVGIRRAQALPESPRYLARALSAAESALELSIEETPGPVGVAMRRRSINHVLEQLRDANARAAVLLQVGDPWREACAEVAEQLEMTLAERGR